MRRRRDRCRSKAGVTLVEVMLAGALTALLSLATLEGFIVAAKIAHENAERLRADGIAFDLLWRKFYTDYEQMKIATAASAPLIKTYEGNDSPYVRQGTDMLASDPSEYPQFVFQEIVERLSVNGSEKGKILMVKLYDGKKYEKNGELVLVASNVVFRSEIPRVTN